MHTTNLRKVGGSVMLAVPPAFLDQLHLQAGATVGLAVDHGCLVVSQPPAALHARRAARSALFQRSRPRNVNGLMPAVGGELL